MDINLENAKREVKSANMALRATLIVLIFALGITYAGQVKDDFEVSLGKKDKSSYLTRVDEVDLYTLYKNQAAILDATTGGKKFAGGKSLDLNMEKRLVRAKQKSNSNHGKVYIRR